MSEAKFTKGEWRINYGLVIIGNIHYEFENSFDSHLIAAAPYMYHELQRDVDRINDLLSIPNGLVNEPLVAERNRKVALLAKARGEK